MTTELEATLTDERPGDPVTTATAECADARVHLHIDDPVTGKSTTRTVDLEGQPRSLRSRLLGLAISEAVLASWIELQLTHQAPSEPDTVPAETRQEAAHIAGRHLQVNPQMPRSEPPDIAAGPLMRWFSGGLLTVGASASARRWFDDQPVVGVGLEIDGSYGEHSVPEVARASAATLSLAPCLLMRSGFDRVVLTAGVGWRIGVARLSAEPVGVRRAGRTAWRGWTGPLVTVDLSVPLWRSLVLRATVESGYAVIPAHGRMDSVTVVALEGSWVGGLVSLGTRF